MLLSMIFLQTSKKISSDKPDFYTYLIFDLDILVSPFLSLRSLLLLKYNRMLFWLLHDLKNPSQVLVTTLFFWMGSGRTIVGHVSRNFHKLQTISHNVIYSTAS